MKCDYILEEQFWKSNSGRAEQVEKCHDIENEWFQYEC